MAKGNGFKLFNSSDLFFSWHPTYADAQIRQQFESRVYGRKFQIVSLTDAEVLESGDAYARNLQ